MRDKKEITGFLGAFAAWREINFELNRKIFNKSSKFSRQAAKAEK
jgi:hypothetical protein